MTVLDYHTLVTPMLTRQSFPPHSHRMKSLNSIVASEHRPSLHNKAALNMETFTATKSMCEFIFSVPFTHFWIQTFPSDGILHFRLYHTIASHYIDGRTILILITLYSVIVFSLNMSWNFTTAEFSNDVRYVLEIMTLLLHAIFVVCSFFM